VRRHRRPFAFLQAKRTKAILARILDRLDASVRPLDMSLPGYRLHQLSGKKKGTWSVWISGNWRVTFNFEAEDAAGVDYLDYH
jgi:proteic killer suppression protein